MKDAKVRSLARTLPLVPSEYELDGVETADLIVNRWLSEHPDDDDEPVTGEWLASAGSREPRNVDLAAPPTLTIPGYHYGVLVQADDGRSWDWCRGAHVIATVRTRGNVRRLCKALGVELNG